MTKAEFVLRVSRRVKLSKAHTARVVDAALDEIQGVMKKGDSIAFTGFGTFLVARRKARRGRHPRSGKPITIAAARVPRFRAGKFLKSAIK